MGFNPRPVIAHGAMESFRRCVSLAGRFNPRPVIAHGAISESAVVIRIIKFQSAPRDCSRGDMVRVNSR